MMPLLFILMAFTTFLSSAESHDVVETYLIPTTPLSIPRCPIQLTSPCVDASNISFPSNATTNQHRNCQPILVESVDPTQRIILTLTRGETVMNTSFIADEFIVGYSPLILCYSFEYYIITHSNESLLRFSFHSVDNNVTTTTLNTSLGDKFLATPHTNKSTIITASCMLTTNASHHLTYTHDYVNRQTFLWSTSAINYEYTMFDIRARYTLTTPCVITLYYVESVQTTPQLNGGDLWCDTRRASVVEYITPQIVALRVPLNCSLPNLKRVDTNSRITPYVTNDTTLHERINTHRRILASQNRLPASLPVYVANLYASLMSLYEADTRRCSYDKECFFVSNVTVINGNCSTRHYCTWSGLSPMNEIYRLANISTEIMKETLMISSKVDYACEDNCPSLLTTPVADERFCHCERYIHTIINPRRLLHETIYPLSVKGSVCAMCDGASCKVAVPCADSCVVNSTGFLTSASVCSNYKFACPALVTGVCTHNTRPYASYTTIVNIDANAGEIPSNVSGTIPSVLGDSIPPLFARVEYVQAGVISSPHPHVSWSNVFNLQRLANSNEKVKEYVDFMEKWESTTTGAVYYGSIGYTSQEIVTGLTVACTRNCTLFIAADLSYILTYNSTGDTIVCTTTNTSQCITHQGEMLNITLSDWSVHRPPTRSADILIVDPTVVLVISHNYTVEGNLSLTDQRIVLSGGVLNISGCLSLVNTTIVANNVIRNSFETFMLHNGCITIDTVDVEGVRDCETTSVTNDTIRDSNSSILVGRVALLVSDAGCRSSLEESKRMWLYGGIGIAGGALLIIIGIIVIFVYIKRVHTFINPYSERENTIQHTPTPSIKRGETWVGKTL